MAGRRKLMLSNFRRPIIVDGSEAIFYKTEINTASDVNSQNIYYNRQQFIEQL
jgi:hypothetical protein